MEADWSVELTAEDPAIVVPWAASGADSGSSRVQDAEASSIGLKFVDLCKHPDAIGEIAEACREPALRSALLRLNCSESHLWTAKCDLWKTGEDSAFDPSEMDADSGEEAKFGAGSYIDLLPRDDAIFSSFASQECWIRKLSGSLRSCPIRRSRSEFILRQAEIQGAAGFGVSWFVEGCGRTEEQATQSWRDALHYGLSEIMDTRPELVMGAAARKAKE